MGTRATGKRQGGIEILSNESFKKTLGEKRVKSLAHPQFHN